MVNRETVQNLLQSLGDSMNVPGLAFDKSGCCPLSLGDGITVFLQYREFAGDFLLIGAVGNLPEGEEEQADIMRFLLISNLYGEDTDGATLSLDPENNIVLMHRTWDPEGANASKLARTLEAFAELLDLWKERYSEVLEENDDGASPFEKVDGSLPGEASLQINPDLFV